MRNAVDEQQKKADALVASLENLDVSAEVKATITTLASFLTTLSGSFSNLLSRKNMGKRDTNTGRFELILPFLFDIIHRL